MLYFIELYATIITIHSITLYCIILCLSYIIPPALAEAWPHVPPLPASGRPGAMLVFLPSYY